MARKAQDYKTALINSLPQGAAYPKNTAPTRDGIFKAVADELAGEDFLIDKMLVEADPLNTRSLLEEWEQQHGLPECPHQSGLTRQERLSLLNEKIDRVGSLCPPAIIWLANRLGYKVEVKERRPFIGGISRGGEQVGGDAKIRFWWTVRVKEPRVTMFRGGISTGGERQGSIQRAEDLECLLHKINYSEKQLTIGYEGN